MAPIDNTPRMDGKAPVAGSAPVRESHLKRIATRTGRSRRSVKDRLPELRKEFEGALDDFLATGNTTGAIGFTAGVLQRIEVGVATSCPKQASEDQEEAEGSEDTLYMRMKNHPTAANKQAWRRSAHRLIATTMAKLAAESDA